MKAALALGKVGILVCIQNVSILKPIIFETLVTAIGFLAFLALAGPLQAQISLPNAPAAELDMLRFELSVPCMGSSVDLVVYSKTQPQAQSVMDAGLAEIERLSGILSNYDPDSEISKLCSTPSAEWVDVSPDLANVLSHSRRWHQLSYGKFDITVGPLSQIWRASRKQKQLPTRIEIDTAKERCGWDCFGFEPTSGKAILYRPKMMLDLSGIAVGYIVDAAFEKMVELDHRTILVNAGGDIRVGDAPPEMDGWRITVAGLGKESPPLTSLRLKNCAVTTSGDLNQFAEVGGRRYSHFLDPKSGEPIERRQSVTVIAATTLDADAGATALAILGINRTCEIFHELPLSQAVMVEASEKDGTPSRMRWLSNQE